MPPPGIPPLLRALSISSASSSCMFVFLSAVSTSSFLNPISQRILNCLLPQISLLTLGLAPAPPHPAEAALSPIMPGPPGPSSQLGELLMPGICWTPRPPAPPPPQFLSPPPHIPVSPPRGLLSSRPPQPPAPLVSASPQPLLPG